MRNGKLLARKTEPPLTKAIPFCYIVYQHGVSSGGAVVAGHIDVRLQECMLADIESHPDSHQEYLDQLQGIIGRCEPEE